MQLHELREKQDRVLAEARERLDLIKSNTDEARATELEAAHDAAMKEYDRLGGLIEREISTAAAEKRAEEVRAARRPLPNDGEARGQDQGEAPEYRMVFHKMLRAGGDVSELTGEERAILRAGVVSQDELRVQNVGTGSAGAYTVPTTLANFISEAMKLAGPMYSEDLCTFIDTTSGNSIKIPTVDDTSGTAYAHTEGTALTDDGSADVTFGQASLDAYAYDTKFLRWSWELANDSIFNVESLLGRLLGVRLGRLANNKLTVGTGSSQPNGIVTASSSGLTAASATVIAADEIISLFHSVDPEYRASPKARFMMNDSTLQAVRKLKDGQGNYLWQHGNFQAGAPDVILGKPYSINQDMASIATGNKVMIFGDFSYFYVRRVGSPVIGVMRERFWPDLGIAGLVRFDSEIGQSGAIKNYKMA